MAERREVIFEFHRVGKAVKVSAVEAESGIEVSIVGDPSVGETTLKRLVLRKLDYVLARQKPGRD
jgi:ABC-type transport system involved in Fe-S cluster assembly fused permease/ATPase subunit